MPFVKKDPAEIRDNPFHLIAEEWMLITAKSHDGVNTMTANWGLLGHLWRKHTAAVFVRKHRHTYSFIENTDYYTLSFFDREHRPALELCGSKSGRDVDKIAEAGLTAVDGVRDTVYFDEARLVLTVKKLFRHEMASDEILDPAVDILYPAMDYHVAYIGEIIECLVKE